MTPNQVIDAAHDIVSDVKGVCEDVYSIVDVVDLKAAADELMCLALRFDNLVFEQVICPSLEVTVKGISGGSR